MGEPTGNVAAFLSYVMSEEGQTILGEEFVKLTEFETEIAPSESGQRTIALGGSTSLSETADKLAAAYMEKYPFMTVTVQGGGSGAGESQCVSGEFDIGMLSRDLSDSGRADGLVDHMIGQDGVAVIVNVEGVEGLTTAQVAQIFSGEITNWSQVGGPDQSIQVVIREDGSGTRDCFDSAMEGVDEDFVSLHPERRDLPVHRTRHLQRPEHRWIHRIHQHRTARQSLRRLTNGNISVRSQKRRITQ